MINHSHSLDEKVASSLLDADFPPVLFPTATALDIAGKNMLRGGDYDIAYMTKVMAAKAHLQNQPARLDNSGLLTLPVEALKDAAFCYDRAGEAAEEASREDIAVRCRVRGLVLFQTALSRFNENEQQYFDIKGKMDQSRDKLRSLVDARYSIQKQ